MLGSFGKDQMRGEQVGNTWVKLVFGNICMLTSLGSVKSTNGGGNCNATLNLRDVAVNFRKCEGNICIKDKFHGSS